MSHEGLRFEGGVGVHKKLVSLFSFGRTLNLANNSGPHLLFILMDLSADVNTCLCANMLCYIFLYLYVCMCFSAYVYCVCIKYVVGVFIASDVI